MKQPVITALKLAAATTLAAQLCGCDNGVSNGMGDGRSGNNQAMLTLSITDAPVDNATEVWVQFTGVELKPESGSAIQYDFDTPMTINLLSLQGSLSQDFFNDIIIPSGQYSWVRLKVNAAVDNEFDSYIKLTDGSMQELEVPSSSQTGLKLSGGFLLNASSQANMTIDFDLRKSLTLANNTYILKPVLRMVHNETATTITGVIANTYPEAITCSDADPLTGNAVYLFDGLDTVPDDIDGSPAEPLTSAAVTLNTTTGEYEYELGFIPVGQYTLAFTCQADLDTADADEAIEFSYSTNIDTGAVTAGIDITSATLNR